MPRNGNLVATTSRVLDNEMAVSDVVYCFLNFEMYGRTRAIWGSSQVQGVFLRMVEVHFVFRPTLVSMVYLAKA